MAQVNTQAPKCSADTAYTESLSYADEGFAQHKEDGSHHLTLWHKAFSGPRLIPEDLNERLHELEEHARLGMAAREAVAAAAAAVKLYNESMGLAADGLAEHKEDAAHHLNFWHKAFSGPLEEEELREHLHELEKHVRLGLAATKAVTEAAAAMQAYNESMGLADEGFAVHKAADGKHLDADWHQGQGAEEEEDWDDYRARLHELEAHVRMGLTAQASLSAAAAAAQAYLDSMGFAEEGFAQHKEDASHHLTLWHKAFVAPLEEDELKERLHELEEHAQAMQDALAAAATASKAFNDSMDYADEESDHKLLPYWHRSFAGQV